MENRLGYSVIRNFEYSQPFEEGVVNEGRKEHQSWHITSKTCLDLFLPSADDFANASHSAKNLKSGKEDVYESTQLQTIHDGGLGNAATPQVVYHGETNPEMKSSTSTPLTKSVTTGREDADLVGKRVRDARSIKKVERPPPLVVFAHGGGWRRGDKQTWRHYISRWDINLGVAALVRRDRINSNVGESFASRGFPCAVLSYPLVPTPFPINLLEIGSSFLFSLAFTLFITSLLSLVLEVLLFSMSYPSPMHNIWGFLQNHSDSPALSVTAAVIILSQLLTLGIIVYRELYLKSGHQSDTKRTVSRSVVALTAFMTIIASVLTLDIYSLGSYLANNNISGLPISGAVVLFVQYYLVYHFKQKTTIDTEPGRPCLVATPQGQAKCVALALRWLVDYGRSTGHFDPDSIVLMGHSAGGHLVSLVALDHRYLTDAGISPRVVKGVISLSAIHDLQTMSKGFSYHIYLKPAFGTDPAYWKSMSAIEYVKLCENNKLASDFGQSPLSQLPPSVFSASSSSSTTSTTFSSHISASSTLTLPPSPSYTSSSSSSSSSPSQSSPSSSSSSSSSTSCPLSTDASPPPSLSLLTSPPHSPLSSSSSSSSHISSAPHRPDFLLISAANDFGYMIEDSERMCSVLKSSGYQTQRNFMQGSNHFTIVRKFGCPWYMYWTSRILPTSNMENRLGYSVLRNFDYSQPFEEGTVNRGRKEHQSAHILSKTCLDIFLPSSGNQISVSDDFVNDGGKYEGPSLDGGGTLGGNVTVKSKMQKSQNSCKSTEDAEVEPSVSLCTNEPITTQNEEQFSDKNVRKRDTNGEIGSKRPRPPPPLVVFAYGGGWRRGDKQTWRHYLSRWECNFSLAAMVGRDRLYSNIGESFASRGFPCAILSYPIAPTPWLIDLIEMAISLSYALAYWIIAALILFIVLEVLPIGCSSLDSHLRVPVMPLMAGVIIVAQWISLAIMISRELYLERRHQSGTKKNISSKMPIVVALVATITTVSTLDIYTLAENNILALSISGILVFAVQCLIFYFRQTTTFDLGPSLVAGPQVQAECVTLALRWLVDYGQSTGHFDPESIILAGHSAGGHLVSLVALDHHYLTDVGISPHVIKGVISLSAVHDLQSISKGFNYHIYLKPAFGTDPTYWTSMSPIEYVKLLDENKNPTPTSTSSEESSSSSSLPTSSAAASSSTSPFILPSSSSTAKAASSSSSMPSSSSPPPSLSSSQTLSPPLLPASSTPLLPVRSSSPSPSQLEVTSSSETIQTPSAPHRPHFLIISPAQDFAFMIKDGDKMCSVLSKNGYITQRRWMKGCGHFNVVRRFGCPWYRYWTGILQKKGGWVPCDGELFCLEFVRQFWNKDENSPPH